MDDDDQTGDERARRSGQFHNGKGRSAARSKPPRTRARRQYDARALNELALGYVARFATSGGRLRDYLARKLREGDWTGDEPADVPAVVEQMVARGYVDDAAFAQARGGGMMRRGFGARRIAETLGRDGIAAPLVADVSGTERERREAALVFARRRRLGPFGRGSASAGEDDIDSEVTLDPAARARQVAAMMRAGHPHASARALIEARDSAAAEGWVDEAGGA